MKNKVAACFAVVMAFSALFCILPQTAAADSSFTYLLCDQSDVKVAYKLNVVVPQYLIEYYQQKSHVGDLSKFVTPSALKPISDRLREVYPDDEEFVNGVLTIVHQIKYEEIQQEYFPIETIARNKGDCDLFSLIAASIIKAGGLDVIFAKYSEQQHMNIAVKLPNEPQHTRSGVYSLKFNGEKYYIAETTSTDWLIGWRVGECPPDLQHTTAQIIPITDYEKVSPGEVSASFKPLEPSALNLEFSSAFFLQGDTVFFSGQVIPAVKDENITLLISANGSPWTAVGSCLTQANGDFEYSWQAGASGSCEVRAIWRGNEQFAGTSSVKRNMIVIPLLSVMLIALALAIASVALLYATVNRRTRKSAVYG